MAERDYAEYAHWKSWEQASFGEVTEYLAAYFAAELKASGVASLAGLRVLELGFGNGAFAAWAHAQGAVYCGVEVIADLVELGRHRGWDVHGAEVPLASYAEAGTLDLVVAFDVFEHLSIEGLKDKLRELRAALREDGRIVARIPSGDSPFSGAIQHGDLTHCSVIGSSAVRQLALHAGLQVDAIHSPASPWRGSGVLRGIKRALLDALRALAYPLIATVFMGGGRPVISPNLVFVLRKPTSRNR